MNGPLYRPNVGAALFNHRGQVLVGRRADLADGMPASWQMPQGGIDGDEAPAAAVFRELREEIGTDLATIVAEHPDWLTYDLPVDIAQSAFQGRYQGQRQKWFALRFDGTDSDIVLDRDPHPEFVAWRWVALRDLPDMAVAFKRPIYEELVAAFARFATGS